MVKLFGNFTLKTLIQLVTSSEKKYLKGALVRNLQIDIVPKGTLLWNLCRKGFELFQKQINHSPGNGKKTLIWTDKILGNLPLENTNKLTSIR